MFHELFQIETEEVKRKVTKTQNEMTHSSTNNAWSNRPILIEPEVSNGMISLSKIKKKLFEIEN